MNRLTNEQRLQIIELYYKNQCSVRKVFRDLRPIYGLHNRPSEQTINAIVTKFRTRFTLLDIKPTTRMRTVRTEENIASVSESVAEDREMSIRRRSQQLGLCYSTTWKILRKDLTLDVGNKFEDPNEPPQLYDEVKGNENWDDCNDASYNPTESLEASGVMLNKSYVGLKPAQKKQLREQELLRAHSKLKSEDRKSSRHRRKHSKSKKSDSERSHRRRNHNSGSD